MSLAQKLGSPCISMLICQFTNGNWTCSCPWHWEHCKRCKGQSLPNMHGGFMVRNCGLLFKTGEQDKICIIYYFLFLVFFFVVIYNQLRGCFTSRGTMKYLACRYQIGVGVLCRSRPLIGCMHRVKHKQPLHENHECARPCMTSVKPSRAGSCASSVGISNRCVPYHCS